MSVKLFHRTKSQDMKKNFWLSFVVLLLVSLFVVDGFSQSRKKKRRQSETDAYFDESGNISTRLWYGASGALNFQGVGNVSQFLIGVAPMVGYKAFQNNDNFSIGPRASLFYNYIRLQSGSQVFVSQPLSYSVGVFTRYKVLPLIFVHAEYEFENQAFTTNNIGPNNTLLIERQSSTNLNVGLGYTSGGLIGYEIYVLYNALDPGATTSLPFDFRIGLTYKF